MRNAVYGRGATSWWEHVDHGSALESFEMLEQRVPPVYGPTADTDGKVVYRFE